MEYIALHKGHPVKDSFIHSFTDSNQNRKIGIHLKKLTCLSASACMETKADIAGYEMLDIEARIPADHIIHC